MKRGDLIRFLTCTRTTDHSFVGKLAVIVEIHEPYGLDGGRRWPTSYNSVDFMIDGEIHVGYQYQWMLENVETISEPS